MPRFPMEMRCVFTASLMPLNRLHACGFPDNGKAGCYPLVLQPFGQTLRPNAPRFLVIGKGEMHRGL